jgi:hypothetical protein
MSTANLGLNTPTEADYVDVTALSDNFSKIDKVGLAYVTEVGTNSDGWYYRKWSDNRVEAWLRRDATSIATTIASGSGYRSGNSTVTFPVTFSSAPMVIIAPYDSTNTCWASLNSVGTASCSLYFMSFDKTTRNIGYSIHVSGTVA